MAMVVTYLGNRLLTWRGRGGADRRREVGLFVVFNVVGLGISVLTLIVSHDVLGLTSRLADNISANVVGLALGTRSATGPTDLRVHRSDATDAAPRRPGRPADRRAMTSPARRPARSVVAALVAVLAGWGVAWLADSAGEHDGPSRVDPAAAADVLRLRTPTLTDVAHVLTLVGSEGVVGALGAVVLLLLVVRRQWTRAAVLCAGLGGSAVLTVVVKFLVARPRPGGIDRLGTVDNSYSFPSGHVLNSVVLLALGVWLLWPAASYVVRAALSGGATVLALGIAASRVYLGYHWLTDVVASVLVAVAWLGVVALAAAPVGQVLARGRAARPSAERRVLGPHRKPV